MTLLSAAAPTPDAEESGVLNVRHSLSGRAWTARPLDEARASQLARALNLPDILARLLAMRGIEPGEADGFLNPRLRDLLPDPLRLAGMEAAIRRAERALAAGEGIALFADYDADGACSGAMIKRYFTALGVPVRIYVPDRMREGYGLNQAALEIIAGEGASLLLVLDCGTGDAAVLAHAAELGLDAIVLDHHPGSAAPPCAALVNPNCPPDQSGLGDLAASGVSFLFLVALNRLLRESGYFSSARPEPDLRRWLDLAALGTICDVAPLTGLNRALVARGLETAGHGTNQGLAALADQAGISGLPTVESMSFFLGPRINAAGRMGAGALGLELLACADESEARRIAAELQSLNRRRQQIEAELTREAVAQIDARRRDSNTELPPILLAAGEGWHPGVIGIVAARLRAHTGRVCGVIALDGEGVGTGSARGREGFDLGRAIREAQEAGLVRRGGGHPMAAGFTLERRNIPALEAFLCRQWEARAGGPHFLGDPLVIDAALALSGATRALYDLVCKAGPFGKGNPAPCFAFADARLAYASATAGGHLRCVFTDEQGRRLNAVAFRQAQGALGRGLAAGRGGRFHLAGSLRTAAWRSNSVELALEDAAPLALQSRQ